MQNQVMQQKWQSVKKKKGGAENEKNIPNNSMTPLFKNYLQ